MVTRVNASTSYSADGDYCCQVCGEVDVVIFCVQNNGIYYYLCTSHLTTYIMDGRIIIGDPPCASCGDLMRSDATYCGYCAGNHVKCQSCEDSFATICDDCHQQSIDDEANACDICGDDYRTVACRDCASDEFDLVEAGDGSECTDRWCNETEVYCYDHAREHWDLIDADHEHFCDECEHPYGVRTLCEEHIFRCDECGELMSCTNGKCSFGKIPLLHNQHVQTAAAAQPVSTDDGRTISFDDGTVIRFG